MFTIFPFAAPRTAKRAALPLYIDVLWDETAGVPVIEKGEPVWASGNEALKGWCWRALKTQRYAEECRSHQYGSELTELVGKPWQRESVQSEAERYLKECLLANPYIKEIKDVSAEFSESGLTLSCRVITVYGDFILQEA